MKYSSVAIITPTTGSATLFEAMQSLVKQEYKNFTHYIIVDGQKFYEPVEKINLMVNDYPRKIIQIPDNTGNDGFNGHRIYAAFSYLVNEDIIMYLDEDNSYQPDHIGSLVKLINTKDLQWAYSLRRICDSEGIYVTDDNCESLGRWPTFSQQPNVVDTNCYAILRSVITRMGHYWFHPKGADRVIYNILQSAASRFDTTSLYTVNYRLHKDRPQDISFFESGNLAMTEKYNGSFPWQRAFNLPEINSHLGNWAIEEAVINAIRDHLMPGSLVIELGSGEGTAELLKYFRVISIEHDSAFAIIRGDNHKCYFAPLEDGWYSRKVVKTILSNNKPSLILVDGPPDPNRVNMLNNLDLFENYSNDIVFDDINRNEDFTLCQIFCDKLGYQLEILKGRNKHFGWCKKQLNRW